MKLFYSHVYIIVCSIIVTILLLFYIEFLGAVFKTSIKSSHLKDLQYLQIIIFSIISYMRKFLKNGLLTN